MVAPLNYHLVAFEECDSTNLQMKHRITAGEADEGTVIIAKRQTQGYGKSGRQWVSQTGNLFFSLLVKPDCSPNQASQLTFLAAAALRESLLQLPGFMAEISFKWPNDVLIEGKKVAGILLEAVYNSASSAIPVIIGVGINIKDSPQEGMPYPTSCINDYTSRDLDATGFLTSYLSKFNILYQEWQQRKMAVINTYWLPHVRGIGQSCKVTIDGKEQYGVLESIAADGALCVRDSDGLLHMVYSGDVILEKA